MSTKSFYKNQGYNPLVYVTGAIISGGLLAIVYILLEGRINNYLLAICVALAAFLLGAAAFIMALKLLKNQKIERARKEICNGAFSKQLKTSLRFHLKAAIAEVAEHTEWKTALSFSIKGLHDNKILALKSQLDILVALAISAKMDPAEVNKLLSPMISQLEKEIRPQGFEYHPVEIFVNAGGPGVLMNNSRVDFARAEEKETFSIRLSQ